MAPAIQAFDRQATFIPRWLYDAVAGVFVMILAVVNAVLLPRSLEVIIAGGPAVDWQQFVESGQRVFDGGLYEQSGSYGFRWSPVSAYVFAVIGDIGPSAWRALHVIAALALPTWPMRLVTLAAWPFWSDVETGNVMTFILLAAAWALRGNAIGIGSFFTFTLLMPRPLMLPIAAWLLWKRPSWRVPIVGAAVAYFLLVLATGWGADWIALLVTLGNPSGGGNDLGPGRYLGAYWLLVGIPLAAWLTLRSRLGWASLAVAYPYVLGYYPLMLVLEVPKTLRFGRPPSPPQAPHS